MKKKHFKIIQILKNLFLSRKGKKKYINLKKKTNLNLSYIHGLKFVFQEFTPDFEDIKFLRGRISKLKPAKLFSQIIQTLTQKKFPFQIEKKILPYHTRSDENYLTINCYFSLYIQ